MNFQTKVWYDPKTKQLVKKGKGVEAFLRICPHKRPEIGETVLVTPEAVDFDTKKSFKAIVIDYHQCSQDMVHVQDIKGVDWYASWIFCQRV
jgi:hypothetical protein